MNPTTKKCEKKRYRDHISAKLALAKIVWKDSPKRNKNEKRAYFCNECKGWHLTSKVINDYSVRNLDGNFRKTRNS